MAKWICKVCGYTHTGDTAPQRCPKCNAEAQFKKTGIEGTNTLGLIFVIILTAIFLTAVFACSTPTKVDNSTVKTLDLNRYMGRWYEIARFDHRFERDMQQVTTIYAIQKNGRVKVINQGIKNGKWSTSEGKGKLTTTPGLLRVSFFGPFYSDYRVMMLAPDYSYALVGGESNKYLWILSRSPKVTPAILDTIVNEARLRGYDTSKLIWVEHP